jgi:two-component system, sensor histidine kinase and response regulator
MLDLARARVGGGINIKPEEGDPGALITPVVREHQAAAPERHSSLFDPFKNGQHRVGRSDGLGLGLSIVQQIVTAQAGRIDVHSEGNRRTVFRVQLPHEPA